MSTIRHPASRVVIPHGCGGIVRSMSAPSTVVASGEQIELRHGDQRVVVVEVGGGLRTYSIADRALLDGYAEDQMCPSARGETLIPWPNRLRDGSYEFGSDRLQLALTEPGKHNAIHGLTRWANWTAAERAENHVTMEHVLHPQDGYPFALALRIDYRLDANGLAVETTATNVGAVECPSGAGAHPYLTAGTDVIDGCTLKSPGAVRMLTDDQAIPTGSERVDGTEFDFRAPKRIGSTQLDTGYSELDRDPDGRARVLLQAIRRRCRCGAVDGRTLPVPDALHRRLAARPRPPAPRPGRGADDLRAQRVSERRGAADAPARRIVHQRLGDRPAQSGVRISRLSAHLVSFMGSTRTALAHPGDVVSVLAADDRYPGRASAGLMSARM